MKVIWTIHLPRKINKIRLHLALLCPALIYKNVISSESTQQTRLLLVYLCLL